MDLARRRPTPTALNQIPPEIANDVNLDAAIRDLPANYNFEIKKTVWRVRQVKARCVALQFPEGLLLFACTIADIVTRFTGAQTIIMGDVTYGACCVDDLNATALGADFMVHYGHSCLVPIDAMTSSLKMLYVFVDITFDVSHLVACVTSHFPAGAKIALLGTIQFATALHTAREALLPHFPAIVVPQAKPLSPGEVLGCTSPNLADRHLDAFIFVAGMCSRFHCTFYAIIVINISCHSSIHINIVLAHPPRTDGRFHLESVMIQNPNVAAFRCVRCCISLLSMCASGYTVLFASAASHSYDPYCKRMTSEEYDIAALHQTRRTAIARARLATRFGLILGTLGRQGQCR